MRVSKNQKKENLTVVSASAFGDQTHSGLGVGPFIPSIPTPFPPFLKGFFLLFGLLISYLVYWTRVFGAYLTFIGVDMMAMLTLLYCGFVATHLSSASRSLRIHFPSSNLPFRKPSRGTNLQPPRNVSTRHSRSSIMS